MEEDELNLASYISKHIHELVSNSSMKVKISSEYVKMPKAIDSISDKLSRKSVEGLGE